MGGQGLPFGHGAQAGFLRQIVAVFRRASLAGDPYSFDLRPRRCAAVNGAFQALMYQRPNRGIYLHLTQHFGLEGGYHISFGIHYVVDQFWLVDHPIVSHCRHHICHLQR